MVFIRPFRFAFSSGQAEEFLTYQLVVCLKDKPGFDGYGESVFDSGEGA